MARIFIFLLTTVSLLVISCNYASLPPTSPLKGQDNMEYTSFDFSPNYYDVFKPYWDPNNPGKVRESFAHLEISQDWSYTEYTLDIISDRGDGTYIEKTFEAYVTTATVIHDFYQRFSDGEIITIEVSSEMDKEILSKCDSVITYFYAHLNNVQVTLNLDEIVYRIQANGAYSLLINDNTISVYTEPEYESPWDRYYRDYGTNNAFIEEGESIFSVYGKLSALYEEYLPMIPRENEGWQNEFTSCFELSPAIPVGSDDSP